MPYSAVAATKYPSPNFYRPVADSLDLRGKDSVGLVSLMRAAPVEAEVERQFEQIFDDHINVLNHMRPGETADVGFNRAVAKARKRTRGAVIVVPNRGVDYQFADKVVLYSNITIMGQGMPRITYPSATARAAFITDGFDTFVGTGVTGTVSRVIIDGIWLYGLWDGDLGLGDLPKLAPTQPLDPLVSMYDGIAIYGRACQVRNVYIERCRGNGLHFAYGNQGAASPFDGHVINVTIVITGEHGYVHDCDDTHVTDININSPSRAVRGGFCGILANSGFHGTNINCWMAGAANSRPMFSMWLRKGGGTDITCGTCESGVLGTIRIDTSRCKLNMKAHSAVGVGTFVIRGNRNTVFGHCYKGTQAGDDVTIAPIVLGGDDPLTGAIETTKPTGNVLRLSIDGFDAPIDMSNSGGGNTIELRGSYGFRSLVDDTLRGQTVFTGLAFANDTFDVDLRDTGGLGPYSLIATSFGTLAADGNSSNTAAAIRSSTTRMTATAPGQGGRFMTSPPGGEFELFNDSAFDILVYPHTGGSYLGKAANEAVTLPAYKGLRFRSLAPKWGVLGA